MEYIDFSGQAGSGEGSSEEINGSAAVGHQPVQPFNSTSSSYGQEQSNPSYMNPNYPAHISCDIKPRLTKEQHDILEAHYQKQSKPNTNTKKGFAESLNVSLDKVNNWFQNRRAKSKQEVKKQAGSLNIFTAHHQASPDSDTSPGFAHPNSAYAVVYQHWNAEQRVPHGLGISAIQHTQDQQHLQDFGIHSAGTEPEHLQSYLAPVQFGHDVHSHDELNRRTLTQEQFNAMERNGGMVDPYGNFEDFDTTFSGDQSVINTVFPEFDDFKPQEMFVYPIGAPLSSYDSTIPSNVSEQSLSAFPSTSNMQSHANVSPSSDWTESRSSSIHEGATSEVPAQHQPAITTPQWQPGHSIPVDPAAQQEHFRQIEAQVAQARASPQLSMAAQSFGWPDEALTRRASSTSLLAQSMGNVGINTPPLLQNAAFKSPAPPSNIAARRQRAPRPAALGLAALRSQSHSGAATGSPLQLPQHQFHNGDQPLRRIRSSNYIGTVAPGRVMKSTPPLAQRSPMPYSFADAVNSQHAVRHMSHGSLAPPTPMSPNASSVEPVGQTQQWQADTNNMRQESAISDNDFEHVLPPHPSGGLRTHGRASPPQSPASYQQHFIPPRVPGNVTMENTPPQSAPASQTSFPPKVYAVPYPPQHHVHAHPVPSQGPPAQHMQAIAMPQPTPPQFVSPMVQEQHYQMSNVIFTPNQHVNIPTAGPPPGVPLHFANGVPMTNANGNIELVFPPQLQFVHQQPNHGHTPPHNMHTPPQMSYPFGSSELGSQTAAHLSKPPSDFFVHEYTPPESVKRSATPRKGPTDNIPRNYSFTNTGPEHFEEKRPEDRKAKRVDSKDSSASSSSPASSNGTSLTS